MLCCATVWETVLLWGLWFWHLSMGGEELEGIVEVTVDGDAKFEAIDAMTALGYSRSEAAKAVNAVAAEGMSTEDILKKALKKMI